MSSVKQTVAAFDCSGSVGGDSTYFRNAKDILDQNQSKITKYLLWDDKVKVEHVIEFEISCCLVFQFP